MDNMPRIPQGQKTDEGKPEQADSANEAQKSAIKDYNEKIKVAQAEDLRAIKEKRKEEKQKQISGMLAVNKNKGWWSRIPKPAKAGIITGGGIVGAISGAIGISMLS